MAATPLLIHHAPKAIQCTLTLLDFIILTQYILHDKERICFIENALYMLINTKIAYEHHRPIDTKLC